MKHTCTKHSSTIVAAISLLFISAFSVSAQPPPPRTLPPPARVLAPRVETRESLQWENNRRMSNVNEQNNIWFDDYRARRQVLWMMTTAQIKKDTERIQFFNTEMMRLVSLSAPLDYDHVARTTDEIKKRAARLMINLKLPKLDKSEKRQTGPDLFDNPALAASLKKLDELVRHFVANPLPQPGNSGVLNVKAVTDARRDLTDIIILSDNIRKSAKRLKHAARQ